MSVWYTAPTALRMLMRIGAEVAHEYDLSALRFIASVGEPLNPEVVLWGEEAFGHADPRQLVADGDGRDHDRQLPRRWTCGPDRWAVRCRGSRLRWRGATRRAGRCSRATPASSWSSSPEEQGELVLRPGWPSMFRGYLGEQERYRALLRRRLVPDRRPRAVRRRRLLLVRRPRRRRDQVGGAPDRPVRGRERAAEHPAVAEAGVIGKPDPVAGEIVKAFVALRAGPRARRGAASGAARLRPQAAGSRRRAAEIDFVDERAAQPQRKDHAPAC